MYKVGMLKRLDKLGLFCKIFQEIQNPKPQISRRYQNEKSCHRRVMVPYPMCKNNPVHHPPMLTGLTHSLTYFEFSSFFFLSYNFQLRKKKTSKFGKNKKNTKYKKRNQSINQSIY
jgi:hypothetical protein